MPNLNVQVFAGSKVHHVHVEVIVCCLRQQLAQAEHLLASRRQQGTVIHRAMTELGLALHEVIGSRRW